MEIDDRGPAWEAVRKIEMRREPKEAWWLLWKLCRQRPDTITVTAAELASWMGVADSRSGRRYIKTLAEHRLIRVITRGRGRLTLFVCDPRECAGRDRTASQEYPLFDQLDQSRDHQPPSEHVTQRALAGAPGSPSPSESSASMAPHVAPHVAQQPPADVAPQPPAAHPMGEESDPRASSSHAREPIAIAMVSNTSLFTNPLPSPPAPAGARATPEPRSEALPDPEIAALALLLDDARRRAAAHDGAKQLTPSAPGPERPTAEACTARLDEMLSRVPGDRQFAAALVRVIRRIRVEVGDPKLLEAPCRRIAIAIVCGQDGRYLPQAELEAGLLSLAEKRRELADGGQTFDRGAGAYFIRSMQNGFRRHGLAWPNANPANAPTANVKFSESQIPY